MNAARLPDWPERLHAVVTGAAVHPFCYGVHDCCTFAADVVEALTGRDPLAGLRHGYATATGAARLIQALGGLQTAVTARLGKPADPAFATVGDILMVLQAGREMLSVCNGDTMLAPGRDRLEVLPVGQVLAVWRIG